MNQQQCKTLEMEIMELFSNRGLKVKSISVNYPVWEIKASRIDELVPLEKI